MMHVASYLLDTTWCLLAAQNVNKQIHKILLMHVENIMKANDRSSSLKPFKQRLSAPILELKFHVWEPILPSPSRMHSEFGW